MEEGTGFGWNFCGYQASKENVKLSQKSVVKAA